ncbi:MAG: tRNA uridine-5-carboxymethylaminomethyl(34) synthesis GTPase MnmE [Bacteroidetes bacterium]|nr:tRNA uridine-5-carboxymethylaminomethyl(34) synthesis GTPase MnmE [Bacteroidota bacterium]MCW5894601.1 tRNA uridine-5-carboxymethylaminomethyl(34) synthesis GTPase MnmE [Bacteroidota bacterium]
MEILKFSITEYAYHRRAEVVRVFHDDTIVARATPLGEGALAVIRVSGANAIAAINALFRGMSSLSEAAGYTAHYGRLVNLDGDYIDEIVATVFRNPHSYTGEDSVEISCHGGIYISQLVLDTIISSGVRQAEPGEFTKRAFLNGRIDLSQAEAVAGLISARSEASRKLSLNHLDGKFSQKIADIRSRILDVCSLLELELDFSEEGIALIPREEVLSRIGLLQNELQRMIDSYRTGKVYREGLSVVIIGKPNAGKSSLFNALLAERRAIVTDIPGTTRDSLEENILIDGIMVRLHDTAGLRNTSDPVEIEGVARARSALKTADVVLLAVDASLEPNREDAVAFLKETECPDRVLIVYNKIDLCEPERIETSSFSIMASRVDEVLVSAKTGLGINVLRQKLVGMVGSDGLEVNGLQPMNVRHRDSLSRASDALNSASNAVEKGISAEFAALDIRRAIDALAEIVGEISTDTLLNNIFGKFCIGK